MLCGHHAPRSYRVPSPLTQPIQHQGVYAGQAWHMDMLTCRGWKHPSAFIEHLHRGDRAFLIRTEKGIDGSEFLLTERAVRSQSLQNDNRPSFTANVTQQASSALGTHDHLHSFWRPQSLGKVEKANHVLKRRRPRIKRRHLLSYAKRLQKSESPFCL